MELKTDKRRRREIGNRLVLASQAFKAAVVVGIVLWVLAPVSYGAIMAMTPLKGAEEAWPTIAIMPAVALVPIGLGLIVGVYLGVGNKVIGRFREELVLDAGYLTYSYHDGNDQFPNGRMVVMARLSGLVWHVDERRDYIILNEGARINWYRNAAVERLVPFEEMKPLTDYPIGMYWKPDLQSAILMEVMRIRKWKENASE